MGWWGLLGIPVIAVVTYDAVVTVLSATSAGGPLTGPLTRTVWRLARAMARSPRSRLLAGAGPATVVTLLVVWIVSLWVGWAAVFSISDPALVHAETGDVVDLWTRAYYAGFALFTLGVGDVVAVGDPWRLLTVVATINGFSLLTLTVSYLIPVTGAVTSHRQLGTLLHGLGATAEEIVERAWDGESFARLEPQLVVLAPAVAEAAQNYLSYPVVHAFHDPERRSALEPGLATLHEATVLLGAVDADTRGIDPLTWRTTEEAFERFVDVITAYVVRHPGEPPPVPTGVLRRVGVDPVGTVTGGVERRRAALAALVADGHWSWEGDVVADEAVDRG